MPDQNLLRSLPSVDALLKSKRMSDLLIVYPRQTVVMWIRKVLDHARAEIASTTDSQAAPSQESLLERVNEFERIFRGSKLRSVINATGIVLHTNLGRAPLGKRAIERVVSAATVTNVELNLESGRRNHRGEHSVELLRQLTDTQDAVLVNNCAAATMMVLQTFAATREVIISRGQLVEIGGGFRLPDVFRAAGVHLREVGTTNRTYVKDYETAINDQTAAIMRVHHSNYRLTGFVTEPEVAELVSIERPETVPVIDDLGSGWIGASSKADRTTDAWRAKIKEPSIKDSVAAGADLTLFSGDKLLGGPQCGIIVGKSKWIEELRKSPLMRAMRLDKLVLAALEATLEIHLEQTACSELPVWQMIARSEEEIRLNCEALRRQLEIHLPIQTVKCKSQVGGGASPDESINSYGLKIRTQKPDQFTKELRVGDPAVLARIAEDSVLLDFRTVAEDQIEELGTCIRRAASVVGK